MYPVLGNKSFLLLLKSKVFILTCARDNLKKNSFAFLAN
jgi:hypothetical protein